jgi:hypothetical protein
MPSIAPQRLSPADLAMTQRSQATHRPRASERTPLLPTPGDALNAHLLTGILSGVSLTGLALATLKLSPLSQAMDRYDAACASNVLYSSGAVCAVAGGLIGLVTGSSTSAGRGGASVVNTQQDLRISLARVALLSATLGAGVTSLTAVFYGINHTETMMQRLPPTFIALANVLPVASAIIGGVGLLGGPAASSERRRAHQPPAMALDRMASDTSF